MMAKCSHPTEEKHLEGNDLAACRLYRLGQWYKRRWLHCLTKSWLQSGFLSKELPVRVLAGVSGMPLITTQWRHICCYCPAGCCPLQCPRSCNLWGVTAVGNAAAAAQLGMLLITLTACVLSSFGSWSALAHKHCNSSYTQPSHRSLFSGPSHTWAGDVVSGFVPRFPVTPQISSSCSNARYTWQGKKTTETFHLEAWRIPGC